MKITEKRFNKRDVFNFADEVKKLIDLLNEPNIYEEYSEKVKILYLQMKKAKEEYNRVVKEKCFKEVI